MQPSRQATRLQVAKRATSSNSLPSLSCLLTHPQDAQQLWKEQAKRREEEEMRLNGTLPAQKLKDSKHIPRRSLQQQIHMLQSYHPDDEPVVWRPDSADGVPAQLSHWLQPYHYSTGTHKMQGTGAHRVQVPATQRAPQRAQDAAHSDALLDQLANTATGAEQGGTDGTQQGRAGAAEMQQAPGAGSIKHRVLRSSRKHKHKHSRKMHSRKTHSKEPSERDTKKSDTKPPPAVVTPTVSAQEDENKCFPDNKWFFMKFEDVLQR